MMAAGGPDLNPARIMDENELLRKNVGPLRSGGGGAAWVFAVMAIGP